MQVLNRLGLRSGSAADEQGADITNPDADGQLVIVTADGDSTLLDSDEWVLSGRTLYVSLSPSDAPQVGPRLQNGPTEVHIPVETMTAADNRWSKSEHDARMPVDVSRYSKVVNPSDNPDERVELNVPYLELHI